MWESFLQEFRREREQSDEKYVPPRSVIGDARRGRSMLRVRSRILRRFVSPAVILVVVRQNVLDDVEELCEGTQLGATGDRLGDESLRNAGPQ